MRRAVPLTVAIGVATAALFGRSLTCGFVGYDDRGYVVDNPHVLSGLSTDGLRWAFTTTQQANWHPLTWLSLMLDATVGGANPTVYHAINVALHVFATLLLLQVLRLATGETWKPALVAALFALHPLRVESVTWVSERKDVLAAFFWMATLLAWVRFRLEGRRAFLAAAVACFALGLLAKPMLVTLPGVLVLLELWPLARVHRGWRPLLGWLSPFVLLSGISCLVTLWAQRAGGAMGTLTGFPIGARLANALVSMAVYLGQGLWPAGLATPYPYRWETVAPLRVAVSALVLGALTALALRAWPRRPWALMGWLWYVGSLLPVLGLIQVMKHLENIEEVGKGIAVAFVATVYGVAVSNLIFLPAAAKLKARIRQDAQDKELLLEGVCSIVEGMNPKLIRVKLEAFLQHAAKPKKADAKASGAAAPAEAKG